MAINLGAGLFAEAMYLGTGGPVPLAYLPLDSGLTVLFGLNGAGKSFMLEALQSCLRGKTNLRTQVAEPTLLVKYDRSWLDAEPSIWQARGLLNVLAFLREPEDVNSHWSFSDGTRERVSRYVDDLLGQGPYLFEEVISCSRSIVTREVVEACQFLLSPVGLDSPEWQARIAVEVSQDTPECLKYCGEFIERGHQDEQWLGNESGSLMLQPAWGDWDDLPRRFPSSRPWVLHIEQMENRVRDLVTPEEFVTLDGIANPDAMVNHRLTEMVGFDVHQRTSTSIAAATQAVIQALDLETKQPLPHEFGPNAAGDIIVIGDDGLPTLSPNLRANLEAIQARTNLIYASLLMDAPALELIISPVNLWFTHPIVEWRARRSPTDASIPIGHLSAAERKWASFSVDWSLTRAQRVLLLDEPESSLHRAAEAHLASALAQLARQEGLMILCATHSPNLLDHSDSRVFAVRRKGDQGPLGDAYVHELRSDDRQRLLEFGLQPADLLARQRGFLVVEGEHDMWVVDELFGEQLRDLRIRLVPLRGAGRLRSLLDSEVLMEFSDAHLLVMLDAIDAESAKDAWHEACRSVKTAPMDEVLRQLAQSLTRVGRREESATLSAFLTKALRIGRQDRISVVPLSRLDILDYLPVQSFVPGAESWEELRDEAAKHLDGNEPSGTSFKEFLQRQKSVSLTEATVRAAARALQAPPLEFVRNLRLISDAIHGGNRAMRDMAVAPEAT